MKLRVHEEATVEYEEAVTSYESVAERLGASFIELIETSFNRIESYPKIGTPSRYLTRRYVLRRFPYTLFYTLTKTEIVVVAIAPQCMRPYYWKHRIKDARS